MSVLVTALLRSHIRKCRKSPRARKNLSKLKPQRRLNTKEETCAGQQKNFCEVKFDQLPKGETWGEALSLYKNKKPRHLLEARGKMAWLWPQWKDKQGKRACLQRTEQETSLPLLGENLTRLSALFGAEVQIFISPEVKESLGWEIKVILSYSIFRCMAEAKMQIL